MSTNLRPLVTDEVVQAVAGDARDIRDVEQLVGSKCEEIERLLRTLLDAQRATTDDLGAKTHFRARTVAKSWRKRLCSHAIPRLRNSLRSLVCVAEGSRLI